MNLEPFFEVDGIFYTHQDGAMRGYACTLDESSWRIVLNDGTELYRTTLYLDREKKVIAPQNKYQKKWANDRINSLIEEYQQSVNELSSNILLLKLETFKMKLFMAETYLTEYKSLKYSYFVGNALKFILFD